MNTNIIPANQSWIDKFLDEARINRVKELRINWYTSKLKKLADNLKKPFDEFTKEDVKRLTLEKIEKEPYTDWTKVGYRLTLRLLFKVIEGIEWKDIRTPLPERVNWLDVRRPKNKLKPEELVTVNEMRKMVDECNSLQDKALISCLFESGARSSEFLGITIESVKPDKYGCKLNLYGKTGQRTIRVVYSAPLIVQWLQVHPYRKDKTRRLWIIESTNVKQRFKPLGNCGLNKKLRTIALKAGIKGKKLNPHSWRHASATEKAKHYPESVLKYFYGWTQDSSMASTYVHMNGNMADKVILQHHGLDLSEQQGELSLIKCPRCNIEVSGASNFCDKCGIPLNEKAVQEIHTLKNETIPKTLIDELKEEIKKEVLQTIYKSNTK